MKKLIALMTLVFVWHGTQAQNNLFGNATHLDKARYFFEAAQYSIEENQISEAVDSSLTNYILALDDLKGDQKYERALIYYRICICCSYKKDYGMMDIFLSLILKEASGKYGMHSTEYSRALLTAANVLSIAGRTRKASEMLELATSSFRKYGTGPYRGAGTTDLMDILQTRENICRNMGKTKTAIRYAKQKNRLICQYYSSDSDLLTNSMLSISSLYNTLYRSGESRRWAAKAYSSYVDRTIRKFGTMSDDARSRYWMSASGYFQEMAQGNGNPQIAYNSSLISKGILLNTSRAYSSFLKEHADSSIMADYALMNSLIVSDGDRREVDSLDLSIIKKLEAKGLTFYPKELDVDWRQVRENLGDDDLAIEFSCSRNRYVCLLLKKKWRRPLFLPSSRNNFYLTGQKDKRLLRALHAAGINQDSTSLYGSVEQAMSNPYLAHYLGSSIWDRKIRRHFPKTPEGKIYFSPDNQLNVIGIEYLPISKGQHQPGYLDYCISDIYPIYRLSSTRQIIDRDISIGHTGLTVGLFGSPDFRARSRKLYSAFKHAENGGDRLIDSEYENQILSGPVADEEMSPLPAAIHEIHSIDTIMLSAGYKAHIFTGAYASEDIFRMRAGTDNILHLATHGFYMTPLQALKIQFSMSPEFLNDPLYRSGLFMSGAMKKWITGIDNELVEDGILTANEISTLDLNGTDMVVLSACQTGQGDINQDGIFGLQRAFKMAGARSMIASLWEVSDEATAFMMKHFYQNRYLLGMSKYDAFMSALRAMRNTERWSSPEYWSAFILIDPDIE